MAKAEGIPPTASVASVGKSLRYLGNHCYAFSGAFGAATATQTMFDFTSGSGYIVATLTMTAPVKMADIGLGYYRGWQLDFNSQTVGLYKAETSTENMPTFIEVQILIPPFTAVLFTCVDSGDNATALGTANITGRVYDV